MTLRIQFSLFFILLYFILLFASIWITVNECDKINKFLFDTTSERQNE